MASFSHWPEIEQCRGCWRLLDTSCDPHSVVVTAVGERRFWHRGCRLPAAQPADASRAVLTGRLS